MRDSEAVPPVWDDVEATGKPIDLLSLLGALLLRWPLLLLMAMAGFILGYLITFALTPQFSSKAVFLPPTQHVSMADGPFALLGKTPPTAIYSGLLLSDSVVGDVVDHTNLQSLFKARNSEQARVELRRKTQVSSDTSGFVTLKVTDKNRTLARDIAANYLSALTRLNDRLAIGEAAQQRRVFQGELENEKNELEAAEVSLKNAQEASGVVLPQSQTLAGLAAIDAVKVQIGVEQVRLAALRQSETDQAPEVVRLRSEIGALSAQLRGLESGSGSTQGGALSASKAPSVGLQFVRLDREVKYHQTLFDILAKQYETARMAESSAAPGVQIVDYPEIAITKSWPPRALFALTGAVLGFLLTLATLFALNRMKTLRANPSSNASLQRLRNSLRSPTLRP